MLKKASVSLLIVALVAFHAYSQDKSDKPQWLNGVVVAYDAIKVDIPCYDSCDRSLIVRLDAEKREKPQYIRVDVRIQEGERFPTELIANKRMWRLKIKRTAQLDEPIYEYIVQKATTYAVEKKYPIWKLIPGAESEQLPFGERISSYSMRRNGFKAITK